MQNSKYTSSTNVTSEEYLHGLIKKHQEDWRTFLCESYQEKCLTPHKQQLVSNTRVTSMNQGLLSKEGKEKVWKIYAACDVIDKGECSRKNQAQQVAHKPCTTSTPSKNLEAVRTRSGQIIGNHKS